MGRCLAHHLPWPDPQPLLAPIHSCPINHLGLKGERRTGKILLEIMRWMPQAQTPYTLIQQKPARGCLPPASASWLLHASPSHGIRGLGEALEP